MDNSTIAFSADFIANLRSVVESEELKKRLENYVAKLARLQRSKSGMATRDIMAKVAESRQQHSAGMSYQLLPDETLSEFLKRVM